MNRKHGKVHVYVLPNVISDILTAEELEKCKEAFKQHDKDQSGTIDYFELKAMLAGNL